MSRWEPVGESYQHKWRGTTLTFSRDDGGKSPVIVTESRDGTHIILLPDDLRLCRLNEAEMPPTVPDEVRKTIRKLVGWHMASHGWSIEVGEVTKWLDSAGAEGER